MKIIYEETYHVGPLEYRWNLFCERVRRVYYRARVRLGVDC